MAFPTNLKDEIKADGITAKQYKQIDVVSGTSLNGGNPIVLQRYDKPVQPGSVLNAKMVNAIHKRLNDIEDGTVKAKKAESADSTPLAGRAYTSDNATMAETAKYAWVSDKVKTFDRSNVWHDDRLFYVHEIADGVYQPYIQEPNRVSKVKVDYAAWADCVQGFYPYHIIGNFNPAGNDWVVVPCGGHDIQFASVVNGNWDAANVRVTAVARQFSNMLIFLDRFYTGNIQLNIRGFYPM